MGKNKTKQNPNFLKNPLEALQGYGSDVVNSVAKTSSDEFENLFSDLLGLGSSSESSQDKDHNGEIELWSRSHENKAESGARGHIEYHDQIKHLSERGNKQEMHVISQQITEILAELKQLIGSSKVMEVEFAEFAVMETPPEVGEYHLNFFDWLLITIRQAREKVEDSGAWLSAVKGKSGKKGGGYWDMFKKHGTSFGMSNERSAATSTG